MRKSYFKSHRVEHICVRLKNKNWQQLQVDIFNNPFYGLVELQALVMMTTHLHLLCEGVELHPKHFAESLQSTLDPNADTQNICCRVSDFSQYLNTYRYIYRNPLEAGLCKRVQDYEFSSLPHLLGLQNLHIRIYDQLNLVQNPYAILSWLNRDNSFFKSNTTNA